MRTSCGLEKIRGIQAAHALNWNLAALLPPPWMLFPKRAAVAAAVAFKAVHPLFSKRFTRFAVVPPRPPRSFFRGRFCLNTSHFGSGGARPCDRAPLFEAREERRAAALRK